MILVGGAIAFNGTEAADEIDVVVEEVACLALTTAICKCGPKYPYSFL